MKIGCWNIFYWRSGKEYVVSALKPDIEQKERVASGHIDPT